MMVGRWFVASACGLTLVWLGVAAAQQPAPPRPRVERPELTAEQQAALERGKILEKELKIARLELALLEAKDATEEDIALKAEDVYRLQGRLHALRVKNPEVARELRRYHRREARKLGRGRGDAWGGPGWGRGRRLGRRQGPGAGFGCTPGCPGMGFQRGRGGGPGWGRGAGGGRGRGGGPGARMGGGPGARMGGGRGGPGMTPPEAPAAWD